MKHTFLIIIFLLSIHTVRSQSNVKKIEIYYFDELDSKNEKFLSGLWDQLDSKKNKFKYEIRLTNFYDPSKSIKITSKQSIDYRTRDIQNLNFFELSDVKNKLVELTHEFEFKPVVTFNGNYDFDLNDGIFETDKEIKKLFKAISKKNKNSKVFILLNNGFEKCRYCEENLPELLKEFATYGGMENITPQLTTPYKNGQTLRPEGSRYRIEFDQQLDVFQAFEVEITSPSLNAPILKRVVELSKSDNPKEEIIIFNTIEGKKRLYISDEFLGIECLKLQDRVNSDEIDFECDCIYECLYRKEFFIRIRGLTSSFISDQVWSPKKMVLFQCSKNE